MAETKTKSGFGSKEIIAAVLLFLNSVLSYFELPSIPPSPEFIGAVAVIWFTLRNWFTDSAVKWRS